jgi:hypothetical protein
LKRIPEQAQERDEKGVKTATKALAPWWRLAWKLAPTKFDWDIHTLIQQKCLANIWEISPTEIENIIEYIYYQMPSCFLESEWLVQLSQWLKKWVVIQAPIKQWEYGIYHKKELFWWNLESQFAQTI